MIGIELREGLSARKTAEKLIENGILVGTSGGSVLRILPPYIISENEIVQFTIGLNSTLEEIESEEKEA
jgi:acetylornithine/succinyldiaminopimelate/putrescine aminotransferase